jgi:hypothetical protein
VFGSVVSRSSLAAGGRGLAMLLWCFAQLVGVAFADGPETRLGGMCLWVLNSLTCCLGLVEVIMVAMCLLSEDGYGADADVEALPFVDELTKGGVSPTWWLKSHSIGCKSRLVLDEGIPRC